MEENVNDFNNEIDDETFDCSEYEELYELNETFFRLGCRIDEHSSMMPQKIVNFMADKLFESYKKEYELFSLKKSIKDKQKSFVLRIKRAVLCPWTFLFFGNKSGKTISRDLEEEFKEIFKKNK